MNRKLLLAIATEVSKLRAKPSRLHLILMSSRRLTYEPTVRLATRFAPDVDAEQLKEEIEDFQLLGDDVIALQEAITAYLQCKINIDSCCHELVVSTEILKLAKSATHATN